MGLPRRPHEDDAGVFSVFASPLVLLALFVRFIGIFQAASRLFKILDRPEIYAEFDQFVLNPVKFVNIWRALASSEHMEAEWLKQNVDFSRARNAEAISSTVFSMSTACSKRRNMCERMVATAAAGADSSTECQSSWPRATTRNFAVLHQCHKLWQFVSA